jgi:hypothetical protein
MSSATQDFDFPRPTRGRLRYVFKAKHHGGSRDAGTWLPSITQETEFSIFEAADTWRTVDSRGWLYGVLVARDQKLEVVGTFEEQVAEFQPGSNPADAWHGYPQWTLDEVGPPNRRRSQCCPDKTVFDRMLELQIITKVQRKRLLVGRHA